MDRTVSTAFPRLAATPVLALAAALSLGACQMTQGAADGAAMTSGVPQASGNSERVIERDVEAPEVFQVDEAGLWDGRPSLGGVWVAHPTAHDPERVLIRNATTGATVIGALFRRERENPGPRFQVSSEAANALGILAGAPTDIEVTALRLQRVEMEIDPAPEPATAAGETLALAPVTTAQAPDTAVPVPAGVPQGQVAITDADEAPRRGLRDLFRRRAPDPAPVAIAQSTLAPAAGTAAAAAAPQAAAPASERRGLFGMFRRREPEPAPDTTMIALPDVTGTQTAETAPLQAPTAPVAAPVQPAPRIDRPFVQIGIFSVEQNAINARAQMQQAGLTADIRRGQVGENQFWRVVVGPASTTTERGQMLQRVRGLGFADAYAVVR
ncbi:SPOR domain-containing protein [Pararhodobacter zhoushanensis]|uniref:SPOR domain-containing protein n=1 Tax=Pararhodobacter zhoushanensis TaxID=2479545 RepID=A0ABT3H3A8_9RHOB|nr:SPOR domain-containing protein [Pararhodobacter zhoushanensis]MCW1934283.1 SPOR domain-containing protein [Pararhodobacter zhoushanensis]